MLQCTLSELADISEIITAERLVSEKYRNYCERCSDPQLREKFQKCAADHKNHCEMLEKMLNS